MNLNAFWFLLAVNLALLVLGCLWKSHHLLITCDHPPGHQGLGIDMIHFGIVMTLNMEIALITPPVGLKPVCDLRGSQGSHWRKP